MVYDSLRMHNSQEEKIEDIKVIFRSRN